MRLRLAVLSLLCGISVDTSADVEHDRIASERLAANARSAQRERECGTRFVVAPCLEEARGEHRDTLAQLRRQELQLDEGHRRAVAEARRKAIADKAAMQQSRAGDTSPEAPRVLVRREPPPPAPPPGHEPADIVPPRGALDVKAAGSANRALIEQRHLEKYEARRREGLAHREAVAKRNAQRMAKGKIAVPLTPGPSASR